MNDRLRVSLSTDAVIYLPFYLAYFGGDFEDTPFGPVDVQIVGLKDIIFKYYNEELADEGNATTGNPRLRGDDFMTLDVLFGVADIGIGDVGFVNVMRSHIKEKNLKSESEPTFLDEVYLSSRKTQNIVLNGKTKRKNCDALDLYSLYFNDLEINNFNASKLIEKNRKEKAKLLKDKIENTDLVVGGGLIRKPALKAILKDGNDEFIDKEKDVISSDDVKLKGKKIYTYPKFSTSYYYVKEKYIPKYKSKNIELDYCEDSTVDFGNELSPENIENKICLSCDFVSLRFANKSKSGDYEDYNIIEDLTKESSFLWSGFILDQKSYKTNEKKYKAFFYAMEKIMYKIDEYIKKDDGSGLHSFISNKLNNYKNNKDDVFRVLVANSKVLDYIKSKNGGNPETNLDLTIRYILKDLRYSKELYYNSLSISKNEVKKSENDQKRQLNEPSLEDLKTLVGLRSNSVDLIEKGILYNVLGKWNDKQEKILNYKYGKPKSAYKVLQPLRWITNKFRQIFYILFRKNSYLKTISLVFTIMSLLSFLRPFFAFEKVNSSLFNDYQVYNNCDPDISNCLYKWQYVFIEYFVPLVIILAIVVLPLLVLLLIKKIELIEKEKYVYRSRTK